MTGVRFLIFAFFLFTGTLVLFYFKSFEREKFFTEENILPFSPTQIYSITLKKNRTITVAEHDKALGWIQLAPQKGYLKEGMPANLFSNLASNTEGSVALEPGLDLKKYNLVDPPLSLQFLTRNPAVPDFHLNCGSLAENQSVLYCIRDFPKQAIITVDKGLYAYLAFYSDNLINNKWFNGKPNWVKMKFINTSGEVVNISRENSNFFINGKSKEEVSFGRLKYFIGGLHGESIQKTVYSPPHGKPVASLTFIYATGTSVTYSFFKTRDSIQIFDDFFNQSYLVSHDISYFLGRDKYYFFYFSVFPFSEFTINEIIIKQADQTINIKQEKAHWINAENGTLVNKQQIDSLFFYLGNLALENATKSKITRPKYNLIFRTSNNKEVKVLLANKQVGIVLDSDQQSFVLNTTQWNETISAITSIVKTQSN